MWKNCGFTVGITATCRVLQKYAPSSNLKPSPLLFLKNCFSFHSSSRKIGVLVHKSFRSLYLGHPPTSIASSSWKRFLNREPCLLGVQNGTLSWRRQRMVCSLFFLPHTLESSSSPYPKHLEDPKMLITQALVFSTPYPFLCSRR